jgi:hypothetical protein
LDANRLAGQYEWDDAIHRFRRHQFTREILPGGGSVELFCGIFTNAVTRNRKAVLSIDTIFRAVVQ